MKSFNQFINEQQLQIKTSAGLAIIWQDKVLLAHTTGRNFKTGYGIPKGGIDIGETPIQAAIRETREEVGITVAPNMVNSKGYQFGVDALNWGYRKVVHYFIVEINSLADIGLEEPKVPKKRLQIEEVNDARFLSYQDAKKVTMKSQKELIENLHKLGYI